MSEKSNKKVNNLIDISMDNLNRLADVNMVGYLSGGSDLGETKVIKKDETMPFAGGSGAVVTMKPAGFLIDDGKGCRYIHAGDDPVDNLIDKASDLIQGFQKKYD